MRDTRDKQLFGIYLIYPISGEISIEMTDHICPECKQKEHQIRYEGHKEPQYECRNYSCDRCPWDGMIDSISIDDEKAIEDILKGKYP